MIYYGCDKVPGFDTKNCCRSCHEDSEEFNYSLCNVIIGDDEYEEVCCAAAGYIRSRAEGKEWE